MMLSGRQVIGLIVRDSASGKSVGRISDIFADHSSGEIRGFGLTDDSLLSHTMLLPISAVETVGINGVIADASAIKRLRGKTETVLDWRGSLLRTPAGKDLGVVTDVFLSKGRIAGLEISGGLLSDLAERRSVVAWDNVKADADGDFIKINKEVLL